MKRRYLAIGMLTLAIVLTGCGSKTESDVTIIGGADGPTSIFLASKNDKDSYTQIDQETAKLMMDLNDGHVIVDVRRQDEYDEGHIPGAICIPNESITDSMPSELPDLEQIILVYCRSGRRSKEAAQKLFDMGYTNVFEFGGIIDWTGEVITEEAKETAMTLYIDGKEMQVTWEDNASVNELKEILPLKVNMSMYGGFEQVGSIGQSISRDDKQITTEFGDIVLYSGNQIVVFYGSNSWAYTKLGHIDLSEEELTQLLGNGDVVLEIK
ncbi:cyclophilin-like fold protein [Butyrivibrio sp. INlla14]|uniref:cyclophilin-like fold protein n=1 Tax=Butyrivibrio sp. INlla14 TaxID=1520808 RepID=UPI000876BEE6|nr:cyclophilin-like fold protein [Butyrivibrio sp. INlla14]SCY22691.1 Rhodanese-related sulfurtransferase [Butyrivibrio sp. INlla14]